ncbi:conserved unknown protein [Ectocarpus siliculosus]|uniref:Uncharacterized protein n=1 Tax=Ectocarpus siliculosus TaxID=2880 RepID=D7G8N2_ECTSI|nr:conserved unknown protein [Ectocarpus siliculosus]|eukprot:CBJ28056.1 conserved unknown protein [Ectocarpus siliculosus]
MLFSMAVDSRRQPLLHGAVALLLVTGIVIGFITPAQISTCSATCRRHRGNHDCAGVVSCRAQRQVGGDAKAGVEAVGTAAATREESDCNDEQSSGRWPWRRNSTSRRQRVGEAEKKQLFTYDWDNGDRVVWSASKRSNVEVGEGTRKLKDYLALPPTEYSLLDPKMITRLSEETFRMDGATMSIVGTKIKPVLFVRVEVQPENSMANIMVERVELDGSEAVRSAGGSFNVSSSTVVSCAKKEGTPADANIMELRASSNIAIELLVPNENFVPVGVLRRAGNFVMQRVVDIGLPQFTYFLRRDYARWAEGDDDRAAVAAEGESLIATDDI